MTPSVDLYFNHESQTFVIQHCAVDKEFGFNVPVGELISVNSDEFKQNGVKLIQKSLEEFSKRDSKAADGFSKLSKSEQSFFKKSYKYTLISLQAPSQVRIASMSLNSKGGYVSDRFSLVNYPFDEVSFFSAVVNSFK